ncbi:hypothetical protein SCP_0306900 [Sparassis crispa]|uniref:Reverse transcriptase domain-containing protein n=1 Tax=Sparassis crispa TaxID=139825 RepID=A0A401GFK3_9APHY|nr:hypothetical protein SCP_0306900 [Sparassis crispa]GBE80967.1 hypothetical protein SCP_0306900 [Sparassis crispa]
MTELSEVPSGEATDSFSRTSPALTISTPCISSQVEVDPLLSRKGPQEEPSLELQRSAESGTPEIAIIADVNTDTSAQSAVPEITPPASAPRKVVPLRTNENRYPRFSRGFLWEHCDQYTTPLASLSEHLRPIPGPPQNELNNPVSLRTITDNSDLFQVVTPIAVDCFEALLSSHPNRPLVDSVLRGLREGFWPFAETDHLEFPDTWDGGSIPLTEEASTFISQYAEEEEGLQRYSHPFGPDLLPGMYSMPVHAVPKPHSSKLRFINDHSAGPFSLNAMIDKANVGMRPDNVQDLGCNLLRVRKLHGNIPIWLFKSDVKNVYRLIPMHPLWQLKQVVSVNGLRRIDRCMCFGSRRSPDIWCSFMSLVVWIAIHIYSIEALQAYMDDNFAFDLLAHLVLYEPYHRYMPHQQVMLLRLWDELQIPHEDSKQVHGHALTIIGFHVDTQNMTITLLQESCTALVTHIRDFVTNAPRRRHPLRDWQRLLGWINWGLNVQPLLCPALQAAYTKIRGLATACTSVPQCPSQARSTLGC